MKRNKRLLLKAAKRIEEIPQSYQQTKYRQRDATAPCGTVCCLAGEIIIVSERSTKKGLQLLNATPLRRITGKARMLSGLTPGEAGAIFDTGYGLTWPEPFASQFERAVTQEQQAKIAVKLLRYIADGGVV